VFRKHRFKVAITAELWHPEFKKTLFAYISHSCEVTPKFVVSRSIQISQILPLQRVTPSMAPPRKRQKVSAASQSTTTTVSRNVSATSTHSTPPHTPPNQSPTTPPQAIGLFTPGYVKHLVANLDVERIPIDIEMQSDI
jgi:hypothetical protein